MEGTFNGPQGYQGYLVFVRHEAQRAWKDGTEPGLIVHVSGDSLYCLCLLLNGQEPKRPMPLNLLSGVLSHAGEHSNEDWGVVKAAIIALNGDTYIGRVFFGEAPPSVTCLSPEARCTPLSSRNVQVTGGRGR